MSLHKQWTTTAFEHKTQEEAIQFWNTFSPVEQKFYAFLLENNTVITKTVIELATLFGTDVVSILGCLDGINESLKTKLELDTIKEDTTVTLDVDFETLYYNMWDAQAEELYTLQQWDNVLSVDERKELEKKYKSSKTVVKGDKIGRNDPCSCGSGKKYKKCCLA